MRAWLAVCAIALLGGSILGCGNAAKLGHPRSASSANVATTTASSPAVPAEVSGRPPQNDDYISTYGYEAAPAQKRRIATMVRRYYAAALTGHGASACSLLDPTLARDVPEEYGTAPGRPIPTGASCATVLPRLFKHMPELSSADLAATKVTGVRLSGERGFVQLSSPAMPTGEISIEQEGGVWKLGVLVGRSCRRCAAH
jgi:hypothetical protein